MVDVEHDHLGRAARLATRLDRPGGRVGAAHERHRPGGVAALGQLLLRGAQPREVDARPGAAAEDDALTPDPVEDRVHRVLDREDEARRALRLLLEADVEPHRGVERGELVDEDRLELGLEGLGLFVVREVAALTAPAGGRVDDPADHLAHGALALGRAHAAAEVLLRDDVRRGLRPEPGELDALLVERRACSLPGMNASRRSHSISSNGSRPGMVKYRRTARLASSLATVLTSSSGLITTLLSCALDTFSCFTDAIFSPHPRSQLGPSSVSRASDGAAKTAAGSGLLVYRPRPGRRA